MNDYNMYFYNSRKGILFNKLFYYINFDKNYFLDNKLNNIIKKNLTILKDNMIYCKNYNNKEFMMNDNDIHWEFTDFIINTAKYHRSIDNTIENNQKIKEIRNNIVVEIEEAISLNGELIVYISNIFNNLKKFCKDDKLFYMYINNNISTIILKKIINNEDLYSKIKNFVKKVGDKNNILLNNKIVDNIIIFIKFITEIILKKIKNIYFYKNNDELNNSIDIECSISNIIYYSKENKNIIIGIFIKNIKDNLIVEHKYNNLNRTNSQILYNNVYKKWDILPNYIKNFYRNFINIIDINNNFIINENNYNKIKSPKDKRFNLTKNHIGAKKNKFNNMIPKINNNSPYKVWYTNNINKKDYIEIIDIYDNECILNKIYNEIYLYKEKSDDIVIKINDNYDIILNNDLSFDNERFTIDVNKILKKIFHSIDITKSENNKNIVNNLRKHSLILSFINRESDLFLFLLHNYNIKNTIDDIETINPYTCFKILQNYNVELHNDGNNIQLEDVISWNNHYYNEYNENLLDISELRNKIIFLNYFQLLINYVNNNLEFCKIIKKKNIKIKYVKKINRINIINKNSKILNLNNRLIYLKKKTIKCINEINLINNRNYDYNITYKNIFLIKNILLEKKLVELDINYGYFENLIINTFLQTNKYNLNTNEEESIYNNLNKIENLKVIITNLNISLILFLKFTYLFDYNKTILSIKNFNIILKNKISYINSYYIIKLDIINIFLINIENRLELSNTV